jgi:hypothetical protein
LRVVVKEGVKKRVAVSARVEVAEDDEATGVEVINRCLELIIHLLCGIYFLADGLVVRRYVGAHDVDRPSVARAKAKRADARCGVCDVDLVVIE